MTIKFERFADNYMCKDYFYRIYDDERSPIEIRNVTMPEHVFEQLFNDMAKELGYDIIKKKDNELTFKDMCVHSNCNNPRFEGYALCYQHKEECYDKDFKNNDNKSELPFWIWNIDEHKEQYRKKFGKCCFLHLTDDNFSKYVYTRFENMKKDYGVINNNMDNLEERIKILEKTEEGRDKSEIDTDQRIDKLEFRVEKLENKINIHEQQLINEDAHYYQIQDSITELKKKQKSTDNKIDNLNRYILTIETVVLEFAREKG